MDWIETWFGVSPDGGSGATEWLFALAFGAVVIAAVPAFRRATLSLLQRLNLAGARRADLPKTDH